MFKKILIANRGEIACRIISTCRRLGIRTVAVYSEVDADARHVRLADESFYLGPAASKDSYLRGDLIVEVAGRCGADAIHPGYGFLSENADFAQACFDAGVVFIGPPAAAIRAMGSKSAAKDLMTKAGVPLVPGYHGDNQDAAHLKAEAGRIGYPVMIKASAGGGGKGMRIVHEPDRFADELASCQRESATSFGDDRMLIEKYLERPRHIEIQVFADSAGEAVSLFERDCSAQRRHQKVVEEAPAPGISATKREEMGQAACDAAKAVGYVGAGTVEFVASADGAFFFMEMNTRLQVEHPVTEMITGLDLVEWQIRVAEGETLPRQADALSIDGHAIEVRLYAEDPANGFLPSVGQLEYFAAPEQSAHVRLDSGVAHGDSISPYYDPMIAKLIVWERDREAAINRMLGALAELRIVGVRHNRDFLARLIDHPVFRRGAVDTGLIEREIQALLPDETSEVPRVVFQAAALALVTLDARRFQSPHSSDPVSDPWAATDGWRLNGVQQRTFRFQADGQAQDIDVSYAADGLTIDGLAAQLIDRGDPDFDLMLGDTRRGVTIVGDASARHLFIDQAHFRVEYSDPLEQSVVVQDPQAETTAPMPGTIVALLLEPGKTVQAGEPVLVMEAMKMELTIKAPADGVLERYLCAEGEQVGEGVNLFELSVDSDE